MTELGMAYGTWADAERLVGTVVAELDGADPVTTPMIRHQLEVLEWDAPEYLDDEYARSVGLPGSMAPGSMYLTFALPAYWVPGDPPIAPNTLSPLAFRVVPCPGTAMIATEVSIAFHEPMRPGDRIHSTWVLASLSRKTLSIGDGAFLGFEITYTNQVGEVVAVEQNSVFRYEPAGPKESA